MKNSIFLLQELFHVYSNRFEFHFLPMHLIKQTHFVFLQNYGRARGMAK